MAEVYLLDILDAAIARTRDDIQATLNAFFARVTAAGGPITRCRWYESPLIEAALDVVVPRFNFPARIGRDAGRLVSSSPPPPPGLSALTDLDILVYFLPFGKSVVRKLVPRAPSSIAGHQGLTAGTSPRASEVYLHTYDGKLLAKVAFHEIMHMKLKMGNEMHCLNNCCNTTPPSCGLMAFDVTDEELTADNIRRMIPALSMPVTQWTGGVQILQKIKANIAGGDSLSGINE
jgi:hypothetical protein